MLAFLFLEPLPAPCPPAGRQRPDTRTPSLSSLESPLPAPHPEPRAWRRGPEPPAAFPSQTGAPAPRPEPLWTRVLGEEALQPPGPAPPGRCPCGGCPGLAWADTLRTLGRTPPREPACWHRCLDGVGSGRGGPARSRRRSLGAGLRGRAPTAAGRRRGAGEVGEAPARRRGGGLAWGSVASREDACPPRAPWARAVTSSPSG